MIYIFSNRRASEPDDEILDDLPAAGREHGPGASAAGADRALHQQRPGAAHLHVHQERDPGRRRRRQR